LICGNASVQDVPDYGKLHRVTSEAKPFRAGGRLAVCPRCGGIQKILTEETLSEIKEVYDRYDLYHLSDGEEQPTFDLSGGFLPRSERVFSYLDTVMTIPQQGALLDFGCGNGSALARFSARRPHWDLYGCEMSDRSLHRLTSIPNFRKLYTCPLDEIERPFDAITLIHSLEHLYTPTGELRKISRIASPDGFVVIQVPDCSVNPYDLLIVEHVCHFTAATLATATLVAGLETIALSDRVAVKELTWIGRRPLSSVDWAATEDVSTQVLEKVRRDLGWLGAQAESATRLAHSATSFGIFGTATSGTWLAGVLGDGFAFFVDEDPTRQGNTHLGRPVLPPAGIPDGADVFVPLIDESASRVVDRLARSYPRVRFHRPPTLQDIGSTR
jgi:2-polyprenyl-3-methyl-5-hydroxy-6-metoxy-1,4-benzoquinol methylase